ncbi:MAG: hypothetical protein PHH84_07765 [Oscillospiraceae bacterium]|nr:hypothetical protein [Oscillospiraceae bacterium]MDD4414784.1 hypothetical protein [Oscillospiraceae bacterium]
MPNSKFHADDFQTARNRGLTRLHERQGIGTLGERSLHVILKYWLEPDENRHEVPLGIGRLVADVFDGKRIYEIQTCSFNNLVPKLERLLPHYPVTVVYPIAREKRLIWIDPDTGEMTKPRRSPKTGRAWDAFAELYKIKKFLCNERLNIMLVMLDIEEYRVKDGWAREGKRGSHRMERIPYALGDIIKLQTPEDYSALLPDNLSQPFTSVELSESIGVTSKRAGYICNILYNIGAIIRTGKKGRAYLYEKAD